MKKREYIKPQSFVIGVVTEGLLNNVSIGNTTTAEPGGEDYTTSDKVIEGNPDEIGAKGGSFLWDEEW